MNLATFATLSLRGALVGVKLVGVKHGAGGGESEEGASGFIGELVIKFP
ncbi:hypothetical protein Cs308_0796 [Candidatus Chlamydia sanziniae]|uniref:Uncharacterized protein n=1 Tax=Candidatus Chlamydia sanziniae TaxID=1806891 RepID=A0A1A9HYG7_9CHLA|nr:hypothetical protein Cs308_0796 [Candidatus Chlamydia sanziniae]